MTENKTDYDSLASPLCRRARLSIICPFIPQDLEHNRINCSNFITFYVAFIFKGPNIHQYGVTNLFINIRNVSKYLYLDDISVVDHFKWSLYIDFLKIID